MKTGVSCNYFTEGFVRLSLFLLVFLKALLLSCFGLRSARPEPVCIRERLRGGTREKGDIERGGRERRKN